MRPLVLLTCLLLGGQAAWAQQVSLNGRMGADGALLVIDGQVRTLRVGQTQEGVKLLQVSDEQAVIDVGGQRVTLRLGAQPVSQKPAPSTRRIVLRVGSGGHFTGQGSINGAPAQFLVDTGATAVSMGLGDARRYGIDLRSGKPVRMQTANGVLQGYLVRLDRVKVGGVELYGVDATVGGPDMPYVLLGNSFLSRFQMTRDHEFMTLEQRF